MGVIMVRGQLILASASPRRIELLKLAGLDFNVIPSSIEETPLKGETPREHVLRLSREKAQAVSARYPDAWVIGADTIVVINGEIMGKPDGVSEAREMIKKLSGHEHHVHTGFAIARQSAGVLMEDIVTSSVLFKNISEEEINWYIGTKEPYDKAGGYAVQGAGAYFIKEIHGSYTNVIGLPLCEAISLLKQAGAIEFPGGNNGIFHLDQYHPHT
jgi:septum formation protein